MFPKSDYYLDESDPDVMVLRRQDDAFVGAFSARGATIEGIVEAAKQDYGASDSSSAPTVNLAGMRSTNSAKQELLSSPWSYATSTSETFQTVSPGTWVNKLPLWQCIAVGFIANGVYARRRGGNILADPTLQEETEL
jgi:hypothetical protein